MSNHSIGKVKLRQNARLEYSRAIGPSAVTSPSAKWRVTVWLTSATVAKHLAPTLEGGRGAAS